MNLPRFVRRGICLGWILLLGTSMAQEQQRRDLEAMRILAPTKEPRGRINAVDATVANVADVAADAGAESWRGTGRQVGLSLGSLE